jgi:hypothetical protein
MPALQRLALPPCRKFAKGAEQLFHHTSNFAENADLDFKKQKKPFPDSVSPD